MTVGDLIRRNALDVHRGNKAFLRYRDFTLSHGEYFRQCSRLASLFRHQHDSIPDNRGRALHIGVLLDNLPDYFLALGAAALAGGVIVGINNTKRGTHLARDLAHTDCTLLLTESKYLHLLLPVLEEARMRASQILLSTQWEDGSVDAPAPTSIARLDPLMAEFDDRDPRVAIRETDPFVLVFTSGTVTAPKAVVCSHRRMVETGRNVGANVYAMTEEDVGYIAMPLFHANALMCGYMPALYYGASLGMARKFSKSQWLGDIRRYGATFFNYTGKPLAYILSTPRQSEDRINSLRICYGNEGSQRVVDEFESRFACRVIDVFGSSEGGAGITRQAGDPPGSVGMPADGIVVVSSDGSEKPRARFDEQGRLLNPDEAIGEIVNTRGIGWFEGYYKNDDAFAQRTRNGWYWSGDLGYRDTAGYLYFAGRDIEWIRVDGENFLARPIEEILLLHPDVVLAAVYGVPDADGGDRVMAALILRDGTSFDPERFAAFLGEQADLSPKWRPTFLRVAQELPQTATSKILKTTLQRERFLPSRCPDPIFWRKGPGDGYHPFTRHDFESVKQRFEQTGRLEALEL